jgi:hypothetical protein
VIYTPGCPINNISHFCQCYPAIIMMVFCAFLNSNMCLRGRTSLHHQFYGLPAGYISETTQAIVQKLLRSSSLCANFTCDFLSLSGLIFKHGNHVYRNMYPPFSCQPYSCSITNIFSNGLTPVRRFGMHTKYNSVILETYSTAVTGETCTDCMSLHSSGDAIIAILLQGTLLPLLQLARYVISFQHSCCSYPSL